MRKIPYATVLLSILCLSVPFARAEVVVGNAAPSESPSGVINVFADGASGNSTPLRSINPGPLNPIVTASFIEYEASENVIYVADFWGQAIRVYDIRANASPAPLRSMNSSPLGQVRAVRIDRGNDEMVAIASLRTICTWPRLATGSGVSPTRQIPWGGNTSTQLNNPGGLALNRRRGEIVVGDYKDDSAAGYPNRVLVYSRLANGAAAAPLRVIEGSATQLGGRSNVRVTVDEKTQTLFALVGPADGQTPPSASVIAFAADASGDIPPLRVISGTFTSLALASGEYPNGINVDEDSGHLVISIGSSSPSARGRVVVHSRAAFGNAFPLATLTGADTGITSVPGTAVITFDRIFGNGFDD
jgi:hypothetical protein